MTQKKETAIQHYFKSKVVRFLLTGFGILLSIDLLSVWATKRFVNLAIDWSIIFPSISLLLTFLPICFSIKDWLEKKISVLGEKISEIEPLILLLRDNNELAKQERGDIYKKLLKLEAKTELINVTTNSLKAVVSDININKAIIDRFREKKE